MINYKLMTFDQTVEHLRKTFNLYLGPNMHCEGYVIESLIYAFAGNMMKEQAAMMRFLHDLEIMDQHMHRIPLGPLPCANAVWDPHSGTVVDEFGMPLSEYKELPTGFIDKGIVIPVKLDACPKGGDHDWVTWTGLRDTKTDCTKCGVEIKEKNEHQ